MTTSSIQVSEEMIEAGFRVLGAEPEIDGEDLAAIYLAMKAAEPLPQGDEVERAANIIEEMVEGGSRNYTNIARAALVRSPIDRMEMCDVCGGAGGDNQHAVCGKCDGAGGYPIGDDVRKAIQFALDELKPMPRLLSQWAGGMGKQITAVRTRLRKATTAIGSQSIAPGEAAWIEVNEALAKDEERQKGTDQ